MVMFSSENQNDCRINDATVSVTVLLDAQRPFIASQRKTRRSASVSPQKNRVTNTVRLINRFTVISGQSRDSFLEDE